MSKEIKMPKNSDEAAAMVLLGMVWLEAHDKSRLTEVHQELSREVAARAVELFANETCGDCVSDEQIWLSRKAIAYANKIKSGEFEI